MTYHDLRRRSVVTLVSLALLLVASLVGTLVAGPAVPAAAQDPPAGDPIVEYPVGEPGDHPEGIAYGPDGNLWVAQRDGGRIDRVTPEGEVTRFELSDGREPARIVSGPDGALWFTLPSVDRIGRITVEGEISEYPVPTKQSHPTGITRLGDQLWFTETNAGKVGLIDLASDQEERAGGHGPDITEYDVGRYSSPREIAAGPDGTVWFTVSGPDRIARIEDGDVAFTPVSPPKSILGGIAAGPDGRVWFAHGRHASLGAIAPGEPDVVTQYPLELESGNVRPTMLTGGPDGGVWVTTTDANAVLRVSADGSAVRSYPVPTQDAEPFAITVGPGGDLWFTERGTGNIGRIDGGERTPSVSDLALTAQPVSAAAGHERTFAGDLPADALAETAVLQASPLRATPLRATPLRATPLRATPLRATPLQAIGLAPIQLSAIPLRATTWQEVLTGTVYQSVPLQTVTLGDVFALDPPPAAVEALTLADIDLADTPLRATSLAALMLSGVPLAALPEPAGSTWCDVLADQPLNCTNGADTAATTLLDLELAGDDLSTYYATQIDLASIDLAGTGAPVAAIHLTDIAVAQTPLGVVSTAAVPSLVTCVPDMCPTLADAQAAGQLDPDATVAAVLALLPAGGLDELGLGALLGGLVDGTEIAYEDGPLSTILDHARIREDELVEYAVDFTLRCAEATGLEIALTLPGGYRMVPGSARLDGEVPVPDPESDGDTLRFGLPAGSGAPCAQAAPDQTASARLTVDVEPGASLATHQASATASTLLDRSAGQEVSTGATAAVTADDSHDPGADEEGATAIEPDVLRTGHLSSAGDVDLYRLAAPEAGSTLRISLSHLPADYDLVVYGPDAQIPSTPLRATPLRATPLRATPVGDNSDQAADDNGEPAPNGLQDVPLRATPLRGTSIRRATSTESVTVPVYSSDRDGTFWIQVSGYDGAHSGEPYVLRATVEPEPQPPQCRARELTGGGEPGEFPALPLPADTKTLVLVNARRMGDLYGAADTATMLGRLQAYAARPDVAGVVVPVESDPQGDVSAAMAGWDGDPCSVELANRVVGEINAVVDRVRAGLTELRSIVLVGPDEGLPMGRVPDLTTVANERDYLDASVGGQDTAVSRALRSGFVLSDDPYGDFDPQVWLSGRLYVPDVALGRLVESPAEISAQLDAYAAADGVLEPQSADVFGYDFLVDGSHAVGAVLSGQVPTQTRTDDWTSEDAIGVLNHDTAGYRSINAHYDHYRALPARSFAEGGADLLTSSDISPAPGSLLFTMGCHAGLNLADIAVSTPLPGEAEQLLDWAQAATRAQALFTGNTGFGYGDTEVVAYSERLTQHYAQGLAGGEVTAGQALLFAKQRYSADLGVVGVYDAKVLQETVFYGLPTYRIGADGDEGESVVPELPGEEPPEVTLRTSSFSVDPVTQRVDTERGSYWTLQDEHPQVTHFRPVSPRLSLDVTADDGLPVHGAVVEEQTTTDVAGVDPVYSRPTIDLSANEPERQGTVSAFPAQVQTVNAAMTPHGRQDNLVLMPGQVFAGQEGQETTQRLFTHLAGTVYRSDSNDWTPPVVTSTEALVVGEIATVSVRTPDTDVMRALVLYRDAGETWHQVELQDLGDGHWSAGVVLSAGASTITGFDVQLVDHAGNVGVSTNKGRHYVGETATSSGDGIEVVVSPEPPGDDGFYQSAPEITVEGLQEGESATVTVDGGPPFRYDGPFSIDGDGVHVVRVVSGSGGTAVTYVAVDGSPPVITGTALPPPNQAGWRNEPVTVQFSCADAVSGVASCSAGTVLNEDGADQSVTGTATDRAGNSASASVEGIHIDQSGPSVTITPPTLGILHVKDRLSGTATDALSGVSAVQVSYEPLLLGTKLSVAAELTCDERGGSCTWQAEAPVIGIYLVSAQATDAAGNVAQASDTRITVVL